MTGEGLRCIHITFSSLHLQFALLQILTLSTLSTMKFHFDLGGWPIITYPLICEGIRPDATWPGHRLVARLD